MSPAHKPSPNPQSTTGSEWGDYASASQQNKEAAVSAPSSNANWVQF